jgi:hypothetical protein
MSATTPTRPPEPQACSVGSLGERTSSSPGISTALQSSMCDNQPATGALHQSPLASSMASSRVLRRSGGQMTACW